MPVAVGALIQSLCLNTIIHEESCLTEFWRNLSLQNIITETNADASKNEYANFLQIVVKKNRSLFQDFQVDEVGLNEFFMRYVFYEITSRYSALSEIFLFFLILSHGQTAIERGFSVNIIILVENFPEETLIG